MIYLGNSSLFFIGSGVSFPVDSAAPPPPPIDPVDVAELVTSFGFSADTDPLFRELVVTFGTIFETVLTLDNDSISLDTDTLTLQ